MTITDFLCPVQGCTMFPYAYMMYPSKRFNKSKYTDSAITDIFGICFPVTSRNHRQWVYCSIRECKRPVRDFEYQPGRGGKYPEAFLKGYTGYIHMDAYSGYNGVKGATRCLCYIHPRRAFVDALQKDIHDPEASKPAQALLRLNKLFEMEKELDGLAPEQKKKEQLNLEKLFLKAFWSWAEISSAGELPKSKLHTAFHYALNNR